MGLVSGALFDPTKPDAYLLMNTSPGPLPLASIVLADPPITPPYANKYRWTGDNTAGYRYSSVHNGAGTIDSYPIWFLPTIQISVSLTGTGENTAVTAGRTANLEIIPMPLRTGQYPLISPAGRPEVSQDAQGVFLWSATTTLGQKVNATVPTPYPPSRFQRYAAFMILYSSFTSGVGNVALKDVRLKFLPAFSQLDGTKTGRRYNTKRKSNGLDIGSAPQSAPPISYVGQIN